MEQLVELMMRMVERVGAIFVALDCVHSNMVYGCELVRLRTMKWLLLGSEDKPWNMCSNSYKLILLSLTSLGLETRICWLRHRRLGYST